VFLAAMTATLPKFVLWLTAAAIVALYSHAIVYAAVTYGDQFQEIYWTLTRTPEEYFWKYFTDLGPLFRPGEVALRYFIVYAFGPHPYSYNYFQLWFVLLSAIGALSLIPCRNWTDAGAGITALTFLFGHHAFPALLEAHITLSNGLVMLLTLVAIQILQSKGGVSAQLLAVVISVVAVLTKEVGLVVPFTLVAGAVLGFAGVRRWTVALLVAFTLAYLGFRLSAFLVTSSGSVGAGQGHTLQGYLSNVTAAPVMIVTGEPYDGDWSEFARRAFYPWRIIRMALGLATVALIVAAFRLRKTAVGAFPESELVDRKWMLLLLGVVAVSSALAFQYTRHRFGATVLPVTFVLVFRSLRIVLWRLSSADVRTWVRAFAVPLLVVFSLAWSSRVADGFFVVRYIGDKTMVDWVEHYQKYREHEGADVQAGRYLDSFFWAAEEMPWPTIQHDPPFVRFWLGDEDVMNR